MIAGCVGPDPYYGEVGGAGGTPGTGAGGSPSTAGTGGSATGGGGSPAQGGSGGGQTTGRGGSGGGSTAGVGGSVGPGTAGSGGGGASGAGGGSAGAGGGTGGAASGTVLMLDTFEGSGNVGNVGTYTWISPDTTIGSWAIAPDGASNHVWSEKTVTSDEAKSISGNLAWADQVIEVRARATGGDAGSLRIMIYGRYTDDKNYFFLELSQSQIKVRKKIAGSSTDIGRYKFPSGSALTLNTWYTIKLAIVGTTITGYFNGMPTTPVADMGAPFPMGGIGVGISDGSADFDDVKVSTP